MLQDVIAHAVETLFRILFLLQEACIPLYFIHFSLFIFEALPLHTIV